MPSTLEPTDYQVGSGDVFLTITIGDGQLGASSVRLGTAQLAAGPVGRVKIGNGAAIAGKSLFIKTVVADVNDMTNHTSVRYVLSGGASDKTFDLDEDAADEGESVTYRATFVFKK